uniref:Uncharacterized protein n=1 Tax=Nelumbo nucifera TaxID=4432 RepID=A0A822ZSE6_NELNU|nr:TPA_asm: hypothetical protein HUJ06_017744 [Nelumbo nucifera]
MTARKRRITGDADGNWRCRTIEEGAEEQKSGTLVSGKRLAA